MLKKQESQNIRPSTCKQSNQSQSYQFHTKYLSKKEHLCDSLSWITLYEHVFFLDISLLPILRAWSRQTFTSAACIELFKHSQEKDIQSFLLVEYPSRGWAQLATMSQEELTGAQRGQGGCWQLGLRRQKEMRQAAVSLSVLFFFLLLEGWCFVWWECMLRFQYLLWPLINIDWFCEDLKSLTSGWLCKSTIKRC